MFGPLTKPVRCWGAVAALGMVGLWGCHLALGLQAPEASDPLPFQPPPPDAGPDAPAEASLPPDPCATNAPPSAPDKDDAPDKALPPMFFLLRTQSFALPDGGLSGINLDGFRTCAEKDTWAKTTASCQSSTGDAGCDLTSCGEDNSLGQLSRITGTNLLAGNDVEANRGNGALMVYLDDYNGERNDRSVRVGFARGVGIPEDVGCDGMPRGLSPSGNSQKLFDQDGGTPLPIYPATHDGCDRWLLSKEDAPDILGVPTPGRLSVAYVNDGVLVMREATAAPFGTGNTAVDVTAAFLQARIVVDTNAGANQRFALSDIVLAGRMPLAQLIPAFGGFTGPNGKLLCNDKTTYAFVASELCRGADISRSPSLDGQGTSCDSLSAGIFAQLATRIAPTLGPNGLGVRVPPACAVEDLLRADFCSNR